MLSTNYSEFVGISPRTASKIESFRKDADETKDAIIFRVLTELAVPAPVETNLGEEAHLDLGEGVKLNVGENIYLFLSLKAKQSGQPDGIATVAHEGLKVDGALIVPSKGSHIHPAMVHIQKKKNHINNHGEIISLSAFRQWHVQRDGKLVPLLDLKDPILAKRRRKIISVKSGEELLRALGM